MCIIAVANQKGGTGKTTTCVNLGIGLARAGKSVKVDNLGDKKPKIIYYKAAYDKINKVYAYAETAYQEIKQKLQIPSDPSGVPKDFFPEEGEELNEEVSVATLEGRLQQLKQDLDYLHINYMVLPDMNAGNGYLQIAYATADAPKLKAWYELYQKTMLSAGTSVDRKP